MPIFHLPIFKKPGEVCASVGRLSFQWVGPVDVTVPQGSWVPAQSSTPPFYLPPS
jgi:hypothetical protein